MDIYLTAERHLHKLYRFNIRQPDMHYIYFITCTSFSNALQNKTIIFINSMHWNVQLRDRVRFESVPYNNSVTCSLMGTTENLTGKSYKRKLMVCVLSFYFRQYVL